jgi:hypothetical protein
MDDCKQRFVLSMQDFRWGIHLSAHKNLDHLIVPVAENKPPKIMHFFTFSRFSIETLDGNAKLKNG